MYDLLIRNVCHMESGEVIDLAVKDGNIARMGQLDREVTKAVKVIDGKGNLISPPFVESHIHLDTVLSAGQPRWNESGLINEGIHIWAERKKDLTRADVIDRATEVLRWQLAQGILHVRSHIDISDPNLTALNTLLEIREKMSPHMNIQIVAFPQEGIVSCAGNEERLEEALRLGADAVGAIPHGEYTRECGLKSLDVCFKLAEKYDRMVNVTCDEVDDGNSRFIETVATKALESGLGEKVTASHVNAMALYDDAYVERLIGLIKAAKVNIISSPLISSVTQGRLGTYPKSRGLARIKELWRAGVNVSLAHDDIATPFYPLGTGNMLHASHMAVHLAHMNSPEEIDETFYMTTKRGAKTLQVERSYHLEEGNPANFVILPVRSKYDAVRLQPVSQYVVSNGKVICETPPVVSQLRLENQHYQCNYTFR